MVNLSAFTAYHARRAPDTAALLYRGIETSYAGYLDADGSLNLADRKKDMALSGGENIASSEVEPVLRELPQIADVAVIGLPDTRWGEKPVAVCVLAPGATLDEGEMARHGRTRLAAFKVPKALVIRDGLPRNPSGKILKRALREEYR
jgi:fatty-acyl-CoA synthase